MVLDNKAPSASSAVVASAGQEKSQHRHRSRWLPAVLWAIFAGGLLVQGFAPRLKIKHNAFVIPPSLVSQGQRVDLEALMARERRMQLLSAVLTLTGALGLAFYYRDNLLGRRSPGS